LQKTRQRSRGGLKSAFGAAPRAPTLDAGRQSSASRLHRPPPCPGSLAGYEATRGRAALSAINRRGPARGAGGHDRSAGGRLVQGPSEPAR
jgi:hypothetical protein